LRNPFSHWFWGTLDEPADAPTAGFVLSGTRDTGGLVAGEIQRNVDSLLADALLPSHVMQFRGVA